KVSFQKFAIPQLSLDGTLAFREKIVKVATFILTGRRDLGYFNHVRFGLFSVPAPLLRIPRTAGFFHLGRFPGLGTKSAIFDRFASAKLS
ncbi:MAG TPA: hypothetical protein VFE62_14450, partial [Gemmataceae bacterium]|nr:hypothetical protein [Gemmataceae bacterium]